MKSANVGFWTGWKVPARPVISRLGASLENREEPHVFSTRFATLYKQEAYATLPAPDGTIT